MNYDDRDGNRRRFNNDASVELYLKELSNYHPMTRSQEEETLIRARKGDGKAVVSLLSSNLRFVVSVALEYQGRGVPLSDLIAEGNLGLIEALKRFDETRGFKFISYAVWWIRQGILKSLKNTSTVTMPANRLEDMDRIARRWGQMSQELGRVPTLEEVAIDMKISRKRAERAFRCVRNDLSLESSIEPSGEQNLFHVLKTDGPEPDAIIHDKDRHNLVRNSVKSCLDLREGEVILAYFGLDGNERRTLGEIGGNLGVTRERVRQIRNRALGKLKRDLKQRIPGENWHDLL